MADFLLHSGGQNCSCNLGLGAEKVDFPRTLAEVKLTVAEDIYTSNIAMQAPVEEGVELAGVIEDKLKRKGQGSGEQDLVDREAKSVGSFLGQYGVDGALTILTDLAEQGADWEHQGSGQACGIIELAGHGENILLGDGSRLILEKFGVEVGSLGDSAVLLVEVEAEFQEIMVIQAVPGHSEVLTGSVLTRAFPGLDTQTTFAENLSNFVLKRGDFTCRTASIVYVSVLQHCLEDCRLEIDGRFVDERLDPGNFGTSCVIAGCAVAKGDRTVLEEIPGRVGSRWAGEGVGGNADNSEVGVLVAGVH